MKEFLIPVLLATAGFIGGQLFQQYILEPLREFRQIRADAIYYAVHFIEHVRHGVSWDADERSEVKQMRAGLIVSAQLVPCLNILNAVKIFGLPSRENVFAAADKIAVLAKRVDEKGRKNEPADVKLAEDIIDFLGLRIALVK